MELGRGQNRHAAVEIANGNPVGVEWKVNTDDVKYDAALLTGFIDKNSRALEAYNDKMQALIDAYKAGHTIESNMSYIFVLPENYASKDSGKDGVEGFMPRGKRYGFVFLDQKNTDALSHSVAHELGHGRWRLQHVFDGTYGFKDSDKGATSNLMDYYSNGTDLAKWQWEQLNDPAWFSNPFEGDEKGMMTEETTDDYISKYIDYDKLVKWLRDNKGKTVLYKFSDFLSDEVVHTDWDGLKGGVKIDKHYSEVIDGQTVSLHLRGTLSTKEGTVTLIAENNNIPLKINFDAHRILFYQQVFFDKTEQAQSQEIAIGLSTSKVEDFEKLLQIQGYTYGEGAVKYYIDNFTEAINLAGNDHDKMDILWENIPDFVAKALSDETKWECLNILLQGWIDRIGTDEEKAVLNILKGFDADWFYKKVNSSPVALEKILDKIGIRSTYAEKIIETILAKAAPNWEENDLSYTDCFLMGIKEIEITEELIRGSLTAYNANGYSANFLGLSGNDDDSELLRRLGLASRIMSFMPIGNSPKSVTANGVGDLTEGIYKFGNEIRNLGDIVNPAGLSLHIEKKALEPIIVIFEDGNEQVIPAIIAKWYLKEYGTTYKMQILDLGLTVVLPEVLIKTATLAKWSKFLKREKGTGVADDVVRTETQVAKITSTDELIKFLDSVDETTTVTQLEEKGIKVFFRGTTRDLNGNLFPGNPNAIANGISTSTDPIKSTIFAIESATNSGSKGVLQIALPENLTGTKLLAPNRRISLELEVIFETSAENFSKLSKVEIPVENARQLVKEVYGIELPSTMKRNIADELLETLPASSLEQSFEFYTKITK